MADKHYTHLIDMIAETEAEIAKILNQRDTAQDVLKQIERKAPMLQTKIQYLTSAKTHYESILTGMGATIADDVTKVAQVEVVEKPKKKSLFKRLKKDPDPEPEEQPKPEQTPSKSASENLEDAIKDL